MPNFVGQVLSAFMNDCEKGIMACLGILFRNFLEGLRKIKINIRSENPLPRSKFEPGSFHFQVQLLLCYEYLVLML
jgi:hypothetical protein